MKLHVGLSLFLVSFSLGCSLHMDLEPIPDLDMSTPDMNTPDLDSGMDMSEPDLPELDAAPDTDAGEAVVIDLATFFDLIRDEVCDYYQRQDFHGTIFFYMGFRDRDGCIGFFNVLLRNFIGTLVRDVQLGRALLDEQAALDLIEFLRTYNGDPRVFPISDVPGLVTPLSALGDDCSSPFTCVSTPSAQATCYLTAPTDCDGKCVETVRVCGQRLCDTSQYCFQGTCTQKRADGVMCTSDTQCSSRCVSGFCATLVDGDDCTANPDDCGDLSYCRTTTMPNVCRPIRILGETCEQDEGCTEGHFCDGATLRCTAVTEGSLCRAGACRDGLFCLATSTLDQTERCFAPRAAADPCELTDPSGQDVHCVESTYCNDGGVCTPAKAIGDQCRADRECESVCRKDQSGTDVLGTCALFTWGLQEGELCHVVARRCGMGMECQTTGSAVLSGLCVARTKPAVGEPCEAGRPSWCADGAMCRSGVCTMVLPAGAICTANEQCMSNDCRSTCYDPVEACVIP